MTDRDEHPVPDGSEPETPPTNARAGAGPYGAARPEPGIDSTTAPTIVRDNAGEIHEIHSMDKPGGIDVDGADEQAGDEAPQSIDRAVGPTGRG